MLLVDGGLESTFKRAPITFTNMSKFYVIVSVNECNILHVDLKDNLVNMFKPFEWAFIECCWIAKVTLFSWILPTQYSLCFWLFLYRCDKEPSLNVVWKISFPHTVQLCSLESRLAQPISLYPLLIPVIPAVSVMLYLTQLWRKVYQCSKVTANIFIGVLWPWFI